ncbi:MAG: glycosyl hydrolase family 28-related protein [Opitutales bacterium]|nr:glycosyl hydrolase family 28-related protein [Opitutales bacterium]
MKPIRIPRILCHSLLILMGGLPSYSEILPPDRIIDWSNAGIPGGIPDYPVQHSVLDFGATPNDGTDDRAAFLNAIAATTEGHALLVPAGTYHLSSGITIMKGIALRGEGMHNTIIECGGGDALIYLRPSSINTLYYIEITGGSEKGSNAITVSDASSFSVGDFVLVQKVNDQPCQHAEIEAIHGNTLTLNVELYMSFFTHMAKINLLKGVGIEELNLKAGPGNEITRKVQASRCAYSWLKDCRISGAFRDGTDTGTPEVYNVRLSGCYRFEVSGSIVDHTQEEADRGGCLGYGIIANGSTDTLIVDNTLDLVRPGIIYASGSGGGVIAYNFVWETVKDGNYTGFHDIEQHNHNDPYHWLIEGNCHSQVRNQNYLGVTILRDKIVMSGIQFECDSTGNNVIGNQLDEKKFAFDINRNYIYGQYEDTIIHGNYMVRNGAGLEWDPNIADHNIPNSYYLTGKPDFFGDFAWPPYGGDLMEAGGGFNPNRIPAEVRYWTRRFPENAPVDLTAEKTDATTVELNWTSQSSTGGQVDKIDFIVARSLDGTNFERLAITDQTTYTDADLTPGQHYWYYVRARNNVTVPVAGGAYSWSGPGGESDPSNMLKVPNPENHAPVLAPIGNQAAQVGQPIQITIQATDEDEDPLTYSASGIP